MSKSILIMAIVCFMLAIAGFIATASAQCATCGIEGSWNPDAKLDEIGNPAAQQEQAHVNNPQVARLTNSQFDNGKAQDGNAGSSNATSTTGQKSELGVSLNNIGANPNPADPGSPVKITAVLGDMDNMTAYMIIKNPVGVQIGNVTLEKSPGGEYVGTWTAGTAAGNYDATLMASANGKSSTFNDVLQIAVK